MLGKLFKYEMKSTARMFLLMYAAMLVVTLVNRISYAFLNREGPSNWMLDTLVGSVMLLYILSLAAVGVLTMIFLVLRFYKNLIRAEGYLMFTLPVTPAQNLLSKLFTSVIWYFASALVMLVSILLMFPIGETMDFLRVILKNWGVISAQFQQVSGMNIYALLGLCLLTALIGTVTFVLQTYAAMSVGSLVNSYKLVCSVGVYIGIYMLQQVIMALILVGFGITLFETDLSVQQGFSLLQATLWTQILVESVLGAGFFLASNYILKRKLNLE